MAPCVINDQWSCRIQNSSYDSNWVEVSRIGTYTFGDKFEIIIDIFQPKLFQATLRWKTRPTWLWPPTLRSTARRRRSSCGRWPPAKWGEPSSAESQTPSETVSTRWEKSTTQKNLLSLTAFCHSFVRSAHVHYILFCRNTSQAVAPTPRGWMGLGITGTCRYSRPTPPPPTRRLTASPSLPADLPEDLPQVPWTDSIFVIWMVLLTVPSQYKILY